MGTEESTQSEPEPPEKRRTKRVVRRVGRVVFLGGGFAMFVLMLIGVVQGIQQDRAWEPYTGLPHWEGRCLDQARELMLDAGDIDGYSPPWDRRYVEWTKSCQENHPEVYELLRKTHTELQKTREED